MTSRIPILIPTFNNPTYLRNMLKQLENLGIADIKIIDSASTSEEMKDLLDSLDQRIEVIRLAFNEGPRYYCQDEEFFNRLPQYFCLTDPDLAFNEQMPPQFLSELVRLSELFKVGKVGLALDISDKHKMRVDPIDFYGRKYQIWEWESQFWLNKIGTTSQGDPVYDAGIDTTFALYNKRYFDQHKHDRAVRIAGKYTCKHLPWYHDNLLPHSEEHKYRATQQHSWYFGGPSVATSDATLKARLQRNLLAVQRYGFLLWSAEKLTRSMGLTEKWGKAKEKMKLRDERQ